MIVPACHRPGRGFTLVELLTVMGILGILVALVVGAAHGIRQHAAHTETEQTLAAIEAGLSKYFQDWHKFPWYDQTNQWESASPHPLMGETRPGNRAEAGYQPLGSGDIGKGDPGAACLCASLGMSERSGPYYSGAAGNIDTLDFEDGERYTVFVDGWGRPVHYFQPYPKPAGERPSGAGPRDPEYYYGSPLLMSEGAKKDMPSESSTKEDNLFSYPVRTSVGQDFPPDDKYHQ